MLQSRGLLGALVQTKAGPWPARSSDVLPPGPDGRSPSANLDHGAQEAEKQATGRIARKVLGTEGLRAVSEPSVGIAPGSGEVIS